MNKYLLLFVFMCVTANAINIENIKNDVDVIEKKDIKSNLTKSKANTNEDVVDVDNTNSKDIDFELPPKVEEPKKTSTKTKMPTNNRELMYFSLLQEVENNRDKTALIRKEPIRINQFGLTPTETKIASDSTTSSNSKATPNSTAVVNYKGICQFTNDVNITTSQEITLPCKIDNKIVLLNLTLQPNNTYEVIGVPNFLLFDVYNNSSYSKRVYLDSKISSVKNNANTSNNITTYYDSRKIEKLAGVTAKEMSSALADGTKQTFEDFREYNKNETVSYDQHGNAIVTADTQKPDLATNLVYSMVEGVFRVVEKGVEKMETDSLPALYQIVKGSVINIEVYSKAEGN